MEEFPSMSNTFTMQIERNERELQTLEMELEKRQNARDNELPVILFQG